MGRIKKQTQQSKISISRRGEEIYQQEIKEKVEPKMSGKFLALNVNTKDYFVADKIIQADRKARQKYPNEIFYIKRIGAPAAVSFRGFCGLSVL